MTAPRTSTDGEKKETPGSETPPSRCTTKANRKERKGKENKKKKERRHYRIPLLTSPTLVALRKSITTSVNLLSDKSFFTDVLPGPASPVNPRQKPFLPLYLLPCVLSLLLSLTLASPTLFQSVLISSFHATHSMNKCSLICLPPPHHQQVSDLIHANLSLREQHHVSRI